MKRLLIEQQLNEVRVALVEDGKLQEYYHAFCDRDAPGDLFLGRIANLQKGIQAAFVDIGGDKMAFLPLNERGFEDELHPGQEIIVQVSKIPGGDKGIRLTRDITVPGEYLVLLPNNRQIGLSSKILRPEKRDALHDWAKRVLPDGTGVIMRTHSQEARLEQLQAELERLLLKWETIEAKARYGAAPLKLSGAAGILEFAFRELITPEVDEIEIYGNTVSEEAKRYISSRDQQSENRFRFEEGGEPPICARGLEPQINELFHRKVWLKCGGFLIIDHTEAMTVIDVNSGKYAGKSDQEKAYLHVNLDAADEVARQLRLRDIGGIIMIDFIDMKAQENSRRVVDALISALEKDRGETHVLGMTKLGIVEMTRRQVRETKDMVLEEPCPVCGGKGKIITAQAQAIQIERELLSWKRRMPGISPLVLSDPETHQRLIEMGAPAGLRVFAASRPEIGRGYTILQAQESRLPRGTQQLNENGEIGK